MMSRHGGWERHFRGKRVWVTGASSGIGEAIADALGQAGVRTLVSARRDDRLAELAARHESVAVLPLDLSRLDAIEEAVSAAWDLLGGVDMLINNAGISQRSTFVETDPAALERIIQIDLLATMRLTHAVAARMSRQRSGHLVAITSVVVRVPAPLRSAYAAAKAGLHGLFDALRGELEPRGIAVSLVLPGFVRTEISRHALSETGEERGVMDPNQEGGHSAASCARQILNGLARRRREFLVATSPRLRVAMLLRRWAPWLLWRILAKVSVT